MRNYGKVLPDFWTGETGRKIRDLGRDAQVVAMYVMTCPSANMIGLYYLPIPTLSHETGVSADGAMKALESLSEINFCSYATAEEVMWVPEMAHYQTGESLKAKDKRVKGAAEVASKYSKSIFFKDFVDKYGGPYHLHEYLDKYLSSEAPSKPLRSQKQKQKQKQKQNLTPACAGGGAEAPHVSDTADREAKPGLEPADPTRYSEPPPTTPAQANGNGKHAEPSKPEAISADEDPSASKPKSRPKPSGPHQLLIDYFCETWRKRYGGGNGKYPFNGGKDGDHVKWILAQVDGDFDRAKRSVDAYFNNRDPFLVNDKHGLGMFRSSFRRFIATGSGARETTRIGDMQQIKF